jgi:hypothetical protein
MQAVLARVAILSHNWLIGTRMSQNNNTSNAQAAQANKAQGQMHAGSATAVAGRTLTVNNGGFGHLTLANANMGGQGAVVGGNANLGANVTKSYERPSPWQIPFRFPSKLFRAGAQLMPAFSVEDSDALQFFLTIWKNCEEPDENTYCLIRSEGGFDEITFVKMPDVVTLLFSDAKALDKFNKWFAAYNQRWGEDVWNAKYFPTLKLGGRVDGFAYPAFIRTDANGGSMCDEKLHWLHEWQWIVENTYDPVVHVPGFWIFKNEAEMVMFKMRDKE